MFKIDMASAKARILLQKIEQRDNEIVRLNKKIRYLQI